MASPGNKELSVSQSESKVVTEEEVALMTSGRDTLTVDQGNNILGTSLKDIRQMVLKKIQSCLNHACGSYHLRHTEDILKFAISCES